MAVDQQAHAAEELPALRARLAEAEETLRAIRRGEVDAIVVNQADGDQVFTLSGADTPYRLLVEQMQEGAATIGAGGIVLFANGSLALLLRTTLERLIGHALFTFIAAGDRPAVTAMLEQAASCATGGEVELLAVDGATIPVHLSVNPIAIAGASVCSVVVSDLTERKRAIEELAESNRRLRAEIDQRARAEATVLQMQKIEALGQLTGGIAHDFNNLLMAIGGSLELLEKRATDERSRRLLGLAMQATERAGKLTAQLLAFARRQQLTLQPIDLAGLIGGMRDLLARTLGPSVQIALDLPSDLWRVLADATQLEVGLLNLALNARDAMPEGGRLVIRAANSELGPGDRPDELARGEYVCITVADQGLGMNEDVRARAFDPFFTTKQVGKGTGLGLSQVYGMARQCEGTASIASRAGVGTAVSVWLPRAAIAPQAEARAAETGAPRCSNAVVLVVDDDAAVREVVGGILREAGCEVLDAPGGRTALELLERSGDVQLLVADFAMPGMNGAELARLASAKRPDLKVLLISGLAEFDATVASLPEVAVLHKPFSSVDLVEKVRGLVGGGPREVQAGAA
jgi:PAS domain S-box-containing protein